MGVEVCTDENLADRLQAASVWPKGSEGFIRAVVEDPWDPTPRLIFRDWLEERDDPRVEFLRMVMPLGKVHQVGKDLREYVRSLVSHLLPKRLKVDICGNATSAHGPREIGVELEHGFIVGLVCDWRRFLRSLWKLLATQPVVEVRLGGMDPLMFNRGPDRLWGWIKRGEWTDGVGLPGEVFDALPGDTPGTTERTYPTRAEALRRLGDACVRWARRRLRLPDVDFR